MEQKFRQVYIQGMDAIEHFRNLLAIPSLSWKEDGISAYIIGKMEEYGYHFRDDEAGNLLFYRTAEGRKVMLSSHMDTVERASEPHVLENESTFYTDGHTALGADDKAAIAAMLTAAEKKPDALFLFTRAEELGLQGSAKLRKEFFLPFDIAAAYIFDASGPVGSCITSAPGKDTIEITMLGRTSHAGFAPEKGINAIKAAARAIDLTAVGRIDDETTCNIGSFMAQGSANVVPDKAVYVAEVRSLSNGKREAKSREIKANAEKAASEYGAECRAVIRNLYQPYTIDEDNPALRRAVDAIAAAGRKPVLKATAGGSDTNNIRRLGIDAITLSAGYENAHSVNEKIEKEEIKALVRLAEALI